MTLLIKLARAYRQLLTPLRKKLIIKRMTKRITDWQLTRSIDNSKPELSFIYKEKDGVRPFGICMKAGSFVIFRCGCYYHGYMSLKTALVIHKQVSEHKQDLEEWDLRLKKTRADKILETPGVTQIISGVTGTSGTFYQSTASIVKPKRVVRKPKG